ncbi:D-2-hydroxyacid dehydrogenase [Thalassotalea sp. 1_MG-2023]|uniref:D-2-hydroxyacid dehydrogenase n=1 Tax=Thalassotalea sp. 1_MG-2023 TaxID=3062680 RepID=UPI0026E242CC|nr:D-2-hydroxyacid dehydrogenase [Thalassotalea sp. 1_MG-2023]MDO6427459.1 D-2-hydroxyacid dehydrogenase [Thalassotalea sp. 1_MG-2023]
MNCVFLDRKTFVNQVLTINIEHQVTHFKAYDLTREDQIIERCKNANIIITNKVLLSETTLAKLPKLRLICIAATGVNNIDLNAAKRLGIAVTNVSGYSTPSVSQYVFAQLLAYFSRPIAHQKVVEQGEWQKSPSFCVHGLGSEELAGKHIAIIGYGNLGRAVATIAHAFGMKVLIAERPKITKIREGRIAFETALQQADIVSLHCPLTEDTDQLFDHHAFSLMKPTAVLVNTARGGVINETDLLQALTQKKIAYAILDVLNQEPPTPDHPLLTQQPTNLKITAHIAWASNESQQRLLDLIALNIADYTDGKNTNRVEG